MPEKHLGVPIGQLESPCLEVAPHGVEPDLLRLRPLLGREPRSPQNLADEAPRFELRGELREAVQGERGRHGEQPIRTCHNPVHARAWRGYDDQRMSELPALDPASPWILHLERAHAFAHAAARLLGEEREPSPHLEPAARRIERGLEAMYDAFDARSDRASAIALARVRLWDAAVLVARGGLKGALTALRGACNEIVAAEKRFPRTPIEGRVARALRATDGSPPLHVIERASLTPVLRAPPRSTPQPEPLLAATEAVAVSFEELEAIADLAMKAAEERIRTHAEPRPSRASRAPAPPEQPPPGFAVPPPPPMSRGAFIERWAREQIDDIGMLGLQRTPQKGDDWRACAALEKRLFVSIDALAAFGEGAVRFIEPYVLSAPAPDPARLFAITALAGCLEGRDVLAGAERVLHRFGPRDPAIAASFASALKLAQNPFALNVAQALATSDDAVCRAIGVEVLAHRGWLTAADLARLADDEDPRVFALVLPALAIARHPRLEAALARAANHDDLGVHEAALDAMALAAHPRAAPAAREAACGALGDRALAHLAIVADEGDAKWLCARMQAAPTAAAIEAVGWAGSIAAVPLLLRVLEAGDDEGAKLAAGAALDRLLGAGLIDTIEIAPEALIEPAVIDRDPDGPRASLEAEVSDRDDRAEAGSPDTLEVPAIDAERWRSAWLAHRPALDPALRTRRGQPWSPAVSLHEMDRLALTAEERLLLHREIAARAGKQVRFHPHDLVLEQEKVLVALGEMLRSSVVEPGSWRRANVR